MGQANEFWAIGSDILVKHTVRNESTLRYIIDATVTATLKDSADADVSGAVGLTGTYLAGSDGEYHITIPDTITLTDGAQYTLEITTVGDSLTRIDKITRTARSAAA